MRRIVKEGKREKKKRKKEKRIKEDSNCSIINIDDTFMAIIRTHNLVDTLISYQPHHLYTVLYVLHPYYHSGADIKNSKTLDRLFDML
jgi:hypothetical protein